MSDRRALLRTLPAIDKLLATTLLTELAKGQPHLLIVEAAQQTVDDLRRQLLNEKAALPDLDLETVAAQVAARVAELATPSLRKVINVTGTLLHTNLGRAPLCCNALQAITMCRPGLFESGIRPERGPARQTLHPRRRVDLQTDWRRSGDRGQ